MNNIVRGTKNFHEGQWQAWLGNDMELVIDLDASTKVSQVKVGTIESQGPGIYFPTKVEVWLSNDGETFTSAGKVERPFKVNPSIEIKNFIVTFSEQNATHVKVVAKNLKKAPKGGGAFLFVDEIIVE